MELKPNRQVLAERAQHAQTTKAGRMIKTTTTKTLKIKAGWLDWIKKWRVQRSKPKFNIIPANLRPWVPHRRRLLGHGSIPELAQYAKELRAECTKAQWKVMEPRFWRLV